MPRYEIPGVICIDATDAIDLRTALEGDDDGGFNIAPVGENRWGRCYVDVKVAADMLREVWDPSRYIVDETHGEYLEHIAKEELKQD